MTDRQGRPEAVFRQTKVGIPLERNGKVILARDVRLFLMFDSCETLYPRVRESRFRVLPTGENLPAFRYNHEMEHSNKPAAHLQVHGSHSGLEQIMMEAGRLQTRSTAKGSGIPNLTDLHSLAELVSDPALRMFWKC